MQNFTQLPNSVITANIPDALFRLLAYCYSNQDNFRYNVPHLVDALKKDRRSIQRFIKTLTEFEVLKLTTPQKVKHGEIPNFLFNREAVANFIESQNEPATKMSQVATHDKNPRQEPTTRPATQPATQPATNHPTNNTNKQYKETILRNNTIETIGNGMTGSPSGSLEKVGSLVGFGKLQAAAGIPSVSEYNKETVSSGNLQAAAGIPAPVQTPPTPQNRALPLPVRPNGHSGKVGGMISTDQDLWTFYSWYIQTRFGGGFTCYAKLSEETQKCIRDHVAQNRNEVEIDYLRIRSEAMAD